MNIDNSIQALTSCDNYFEDFQVGKVFRHMRGKTMTEMDNVLLTNLTMNSAQAHFNEDFMKSLPFKQRVTFGGVTAALVIGLASQDTGENVITELGMTGMRLKVPVFHGDTLYALSRVEEVKDHPDEGRLGVVVFQHWGINQNEQVVFRCLRTVAIKRRNYWSHE